MLELSPREIVRLVEFGEIAAFADMFNAAPPEFAAEHGLRATHFGAAMAFSMRTLPAIIFNRIIALGLEKPVAEPLLDEVVAHYQGLGIHHWAVQVSPIVHAPDLPGWLEARGLQPTNRWACFYRHTAAPAQVNTAFRVKRVGADEAEPFAITWSKRRAAASPLLTPWMVALVGRPGWQHYLAYDGDLPVATGALFVENGVGWLGLAGTIPTYRKQGGQSALIAERIRGGLESGCQWFVVQTDDHTADRPNPSYLNLERQGFRLAYMRPNYETGNRRRD